MLIITFCFFLSSKGQNVEFETQLFQMDDSATVLFKAEKYNEAFPTLIEDCLRSEGKLCFSVYKYNRDERNSFPVYHAHGVVFRNSEPGFQQEIVLTGNDYHRVYSEVFDWFYVEQLHALTRCTCFFIGLSLNDPNLRRLLEIAKRNISKSVRHYVFLERKSAYDEIKKSWNRLPNKREYACGFKAKVTWCKGNDEHRKLPKLQKLLIAKE